MTDALLLRDLHFGYGRTPAVRGVSLRLAPGDCYGFLGHNGAGKTTVMRLALGLLRPRRGSVHVFGLDAEQERRAANSLVGAVIEQPGFHLHSTAQRNLIALARLQGIARAGARTEADRVLETVGLSTAARRRVGTFSLGMRQRLGIAQALLGGPRLLLLDEPGNGLDPEGITELRTLLLRLCREEGCTVMLSSHQLAELEGLCNRIGVLREGALVTEGDLDSLRRQVSTRHVIAGEPLAAMRLQLDALGLEPTVDGSRMLVDLRDHPPAVVARQLATAANLSEFAPERATLEQIYLQAHATTAPAVTVTAPPAAAAAAAAPTPRQGAAINAGRRAFWFELGQLRRQRASLPLLVLLPSATAVWSVHSYGERVDAALALVQTGERFSADAGSGFLATAQSLQTATPLLALALIWFASQSIAADLSGDTLRNTLVRSVRRRDALFGKFAALLVTMVTAWLLLVTAAAGAAALTVGFGDLEEISSYGDRDLLTSATEVWPTLAIAAAHMLLPLAALVAIGLLASAVARRPARALAAALLLLLGPELLRGATGEHAGWLLTSHLPIGLRDDSALGYAAAIARGAADALWPWVDYAILVPLLWLVVACGFLTLLFRSLRVS